MWGTHTTLLHRWVMDGGVHGCLWRPRPASVHPGCGGVPVPAPVMGAGERGSCGIHMRRRVSEQRIIECNFQRVHNCKGSFTSKQALSVLCIVTDAHALLYLTFDLKHISLHVRIHRTSNLPDNYLRVNPPEPLFFFFFAISP